MRVNFAIFRYFYLAFIPKYFLAKMYIRDLNDLSVDTLKSLGIRAIVFDIDQTIALPNEDSVNDRIKDVFEQLRTNFNVCALSNSEITLPPDQAFFRAQKLEKEYSLRVILPELKKPHPSAFRTAALLLKEKAQGIAFIGDRLLTDTVGANYFGFFSIQVMPLDTRADPLIIRLVRPFEDLIVKLYSLLFSDQSRG